MQEAEDIYEVNTMNTNYQDEIPRGYLETLAK